jgi:hypothetical protein
VSEGGAAELLSPLVATAEQATVMSAPIIWIAGPTRYYEGKYTAFDLAWEFVAENRNQQLLRYRLRYKAETRKFTVQALKSDIGDQAHVSTIRRFYQHVAIGRSDLPRGDLLTALKAMLPAAEIGFATALGITGRRQG